MFLCDLKLLKKCCPIYLKRKFSKLNSREKWFSVVGLEVHAQISSKSKLFSGSENEFASAVNSNVSLFDCSIPGTLPTLNKKCVEAAVLTALALNCKVNPVSTFDRKHYFYADMPCGYQITQQRSPLAVNGVLNFHVYSPGVHKASYSVRSRIKQLQLEQDSGKTLHDEARSLVDLNRAGTPLMELVFEPDLKDGEEAASLIKELVNILQRIRTCSCKMEEGALRVDANISVNRKGEPLGTRTEIKNIGSVRGVAGAVKYEIDRQIQILESGGRIVNETRAWDAITKTTLAMRDKEQVQDYRYMPEPNLPPLHIAIGPIERGCVQADVLRETIPELPEQSRVRLKGLGVTAEQAIILVNESLLLSLFETTVSQRNLDPKLIANVLINDFLTHIHKEKLKVEETTVDENHFGEVLELLHNGAVNRKTARYLLEKVIQRHPDAPSKIVEGEDLAQITDADEIERLCESIVRDNDTIVRQYKAGKTKVFKALLGLVATRSKQKADMNVATTILKKVLNK